MGEQGVKTHNQAGLLDVTSKAGILREETVAYRSIYGSVKSHYLQLDAFRHTGMDHLSAMLDRDLDDLVASEVSPDRRVLAALPNDIGFVGLCNTIAMSVVTRDTEHKHTSRDSRCRTYSACACQGGPHNYSDVSNRYTSISRPTQPYLKTAIVCSDSSCAWESKLDKTSYYGSRHGPYESESGFLNIPS